ncbi:RHS repeat domain-containing protein [Pirellulaceae bacterium SH467]
MSLSCLVWDDDSATEMQRLASVLDAKSNTERTGGVACAQPPATICYAFGILWAIDDRKDMNHWQKMGARRCKCCCLNPLFRNTSSIDALGAVTSTNFDVFGNVTSVVDPLNNTTSYTYNKLQQLVTENKGTDRSFSYDANGNLATLTDRNSRVTTYTYDNRNRLTNESWGGTRTLGYTYDSIDRLTAISDSDSLALDFSFGYDSRSQLQGEVQSGSSYLLGKSFAFDRDYDNVGNQTKLASIIGGALSGTDITGGIKDFANTYTYDYLNRRTSATQSQVSGGNSVAAKHVTTAFNLASQITDVRRYSDTTNSSANLEAHTRHSFDSAGRLKSITHSKTELGAGVNWDGTSSLPSTGTFAAYFLNYDADNRITSLASRADGFVTNFTYDIIDQLTAATTSAISGLSMPFSPTAESYNLDENGNRKSSGGASQSASGTHNRLQTDGTYNYTYDNEGNVTRRTKISDSTVTDYTWDYRNRLATVTDKVSASGATLKQVEYTYDAFDQRTAKRVDTDGNGTWDRYEVYTWADGQEVQRWVDTDGAGTGQKLRLANRYLWAESVDQLLSDEQYASGTGMEVDATTASGTAGTTLWALTDHLGSVRDLLDNNGVVREHNVFDSFGRLIREVDYNSSGTAISSTDAAAVDSIFGYTGRDWDSDIGMQYNRARWYDPQTGRWLSQDPIGFAAGDANLYRYVGNHPSYANDPSGLQEPLHPISLPNQHSPYVKNAFGEWVENTWYNGRNRPSLLDWIQAQEKNSKFSRPYSESGYCEMGPETQWHIDRRLREEAHQRQIERWQMIYALQEASINLLSAGRGGAALPPRRGVPIPFPPRTPVGQYPFIPAAPVRTVPQGQTRVYRAVSEAEYLDAMKNGSLRPKYGEMEGKWFADSLEGAKLHGEALHGPGKYRIIEADVPTKPKSLYQHENMDGRGPARYIHCEDLGGVVPRNPGE